MHLKRRRSKYFRFPFGRRKAAPLIVIDGVEQAAGYDFKNIAPDDIERIDVLKDAAAIKKFGEKGKTV